MRRPIPGLSRILQQNPPTGCARVLEFMVNPPKMLISTYRPQTALWARTAMRCLCSCPNSSEEHMPATLPISNRILAALSPGDFDALRAQLEPVPLSHSQALSHPGAPIEHIYFPEEGMVSLVQPLHGAMIEVG